VAFFFISMVCGRSRPAISLVVEYDSVVTLLSGLRC
jgi:hypothetical protein